MAANIPGIVSVAVFYAIIMVIGIIAGRKTAHARTAEGLFVANRNLGMVVSIFTMTATLVGGGYINGSAEKMAYKGFLWTQAPVGYSLSLVIAALFYAKKMRTEGYVTMFDPFQIKYGRRIVGLLFIPQLLGDIFWGAAILSALGATLSTILDLDMTISITISAAIAIVYTFFGGLYAVAYTDVIQLIFIAIGLFLAFPFALTHEAVDLGKVEQTWLGHVDFSDAGRYLDIELLLLLGGIPWQVLYQRILACRTPHQAVVSSLAGAFFTLMFAIPPCAIGVVGAAADWNATMYDGPLPIPKDRQSFVLPMVLQYLTPLPVSLFGMGAVAAAVMSSADSCILSAGTVFTYNIYKSFLRPNAREREMLWVLRVSIVVVGCLATLIGSIATSVYGLYVMCSDLMFVIMFPQLTCVLWVEKSNAYGCVCAFFVSSFLRLTAGEPLIGLPAVFEYPYYDAERGQLLPYRTIIMVLGFVILIAVSYLTDYVFMTEKLPIRYDVLGVIARADKCRKEQVKTQEMKTIGQTGTTENAL